MSQRLEGPEIVSMCDYVLNLNDAEWDKFQTDLHWYGSTKRQTNREIFQEWKTQKWNDPIVHKYYLPTLLDIKRWVNKERSTNV